MADIRVSIPGVGDVDFPDTMSPDEINAAAKRLHDEGNTPAAVNARLKKANETPLQEPTTFLGGLMKGMRESDNPVVGPWMRGGPDTIASGVDKLKQGRLLGGGADIVKGAMTTAAPLALPFGLVAAPVGTVGGLIGGTIGGVAAEQGATALGADEDTANAAGVAGGLIGGGIGAAGAKPAAGYVGPKLVARGERLAKTPPITRHAQAGAATLILGPKAGAAVEAIQSPALNKGLGLVLSKAGGVPVPAAAPALRLTKAAKVPPTLEEQLGVTGNHTKLDTMPATEPPVRMRAPAAEPPHPMAGSRPTSFEDLASELGLDPSALRNEAVPTAGSPQATPAAPQGPVAPPAAVASPAAAGPAKTPFQQLSEAGAFDGDRSTGHFIEGRGGLNSITPEEWAKLKGGPQPVVATPAVAAETPDMIVSRSLNRGRYAPNAEPVELPRPAEMAAGSLDEPAAVTPEAVAASYAQKAGLPEPTPHTPVVADPAEGMQVADAYDAMQHNPSDPAVRASYDALKSEVGAQYQHLVENGLKAEPWTGEGQPYKTSAEMTKDVRENNHLFYFPTEEGFGSTAAAADHPLLGPSPSGSGLSANDELRIVHDYLAHAAPGHQFGPSGEKNAFLEHLKLLSPDAQRALATETHGQNSWVNFGPHMRDESGALFAKGSKGYLGPMDRPFAPQKAGLLPPDLTPQIKAAIAKVENPSAREMLAQELLRRDSFAKMGTGSKKSYASKGKKS